MDITTRRILALVFIISVYAILVYIKPFFIIGAIIFTPIFLMIIFSSDDKPSSSSDTSAEEHRIPNGPQSIREAEKQIDKDAAKIFNQSIKNGISYSEAKEAEIEYARSKKEDLHDSWRHR